MLVFDPQATLMLYYTRKCQEEKMGGEIADESNYQNISRVFIAGTDGFGIVNELHCTEGE